MTVFMGWLDDWLSALSILFINVTNFRCTVCENKAGRAMIGTMDIDLVFLIDKSNPHMIEIAPDFIDFIVQNVKCEAHASYASTVKFRLKSIGFGNLRRVPFFETEFHDNSSFWDEFSNIPCESGSERFDKETFSTKCKALKYKWDNAKATISKPDDQYFFREFLRDFYSCDSNSGNHCYVDLFEAIASAVMADWRKGSRSRQCIIALTNSLPNPYGTNGDCPSYPRSIPSSFDTLFDWWHGNEKVSDTFSVMAGRLAVLTTKNNTIPELATWERFVPIYIEESSKKHLEPAVSAFQIDMYCLVSMLVWRL